MRVVVCGSLRGVRCLLLVGGLRLCVAYCSLFAAFFFACLLVRCSLSVVRCSLFVVQCALLFVVWSVVRCSLLAVRCVLSDVCCVLRAVCL